MISLKNLAICPQCESHEIDYIANSGITVIFTCRGCHESFGLKWLSENDMRKISKTRELKNAR